jgi:hypothetical protein
MDTRSVGLPQSASAHVAESTATPRLGIPAPETSPPLIRFTREADGTWSVVTADNQRHGSFADIGDALHFARQSCEAAPATLWLNVDGLVVVVQQDYGWTRPLVGARNSGP